MSVEYEPFTYPYAKRLCAQLLNKYPFAAVSVLGRTVSKRAIFALSAGDASGESVLFVSGLSGADGVQSLLLYRFFERICHATAHDGTLCGVKLRKSLRGRRVVIVPCLNPDAPEIRRAGPLGAGTYAGMVSRAGTEDYSHWCANARGVHIEHNFAFCHTPYPFQTAGAKTDGDTVYAGPAPESEAETQALVRLCRSTPFRHGILLHGTGGRIFGSTPVSPATNDDVPLMARILAAAGEYTLSAKTPPLSCGSFPEWFSADCGAPAFELSAVRAAEPETQAEFDALWQETQEVLLLSAML